MKCIGTPFSAASIPNAGRRSLKNLQMIGSGKPKVLLDGSGVRYIPTGHIL
jgi:hypothetical protein